MFGYYALKDKIAEQKDLINELKIDIEYLNRNIHDLKDDIEDFEVPSFQTLSENIVENMKRLNSMINEFKGLVSIVRGEAATKPKKAPEKRSKPKKNVDWPSTDIKKKEKSNDS